MICNAHTRPRREWLGADRWLSLAAAPTFAVMALVTAMAGRGASDVLCSADASPFGGMITMYLLMSAVHSPPWLRLIPALREVWSKRTTHE